MHRRACMPGAQLKMQHGDPAVQTPGYAERIWLHTRSRFWKN
ncbi:MAG: hypothetical protein WBB73_07575 [Candidatus Aminicenantaceae bacterium]